MSIRHPFPEPPTAGTVATIAPGILWLRMALPFALDHINLYLFEEPDGWSLFDTGLGVEESIAVWESLLDGPVLSGRPVTRLIVSHHHPDHVGLAGWMHRRFAPHFMMTQGEYLYARMLQSPRTPADDEAHTRFFHACGLDGAGIEAMMGRGMNYLKRTSGLPPTFERLADGDTLSLGGRSWRVLTGGGHTLEQAMLFCAEENIILTADQVLTHISPNVGVPLTQPESDPLANFLETLDALDAVCDDDTLALPSHHLPFRGLGVRAAELRDHHARRCDDLLDACRERPATVVDLLPSLFNRRLDAHQMGFAVAEALAHVNHLRRQGALIRDIDTDGIWRYRAA